MRKNNSVHVEGFDELNKALRRVGDKAGGKILARAAEEGATVIANEAKLLAPRKTGALARGIKAVPGKLRVGRATFDVGYARKTWYGRLMELGTKKMAARPFLRPALDRKADEAQRIFSRAIRRALRDVL